MKVKALIGTLFVSALCIGSWSPSAAARGAAECDKLTGRDRSKCLADVRRNKKDESENNQPIQVKPKKAPSVPDKTYAPPPDLFKASVWERIDIPSPAGFPRLDQLNSADGRLYASAQWAEGMDTVSKVARKKLTCLATVYAMIEHARGNSNFRVGSNTYSDNVGALGITGVSGSRGLTNMDALKTEFQSGNPVILWGPLTKNPADQFGHFILAIGVNSAGQIVAHDPYGGQLVTINPATRKVSGSSAISIVEKYRTVRM